MIGGWCEKADLENSLYVLFLSSASGAEILEMVVDFWRRGCSQSRLV